MLFQALRADAMAELGLGMAADIRLDLVPVATVVANLLATGANAEQLQSVIDKLDATKTDLEGTII